ncbi:hypothetical protein ACCT18_30320 [Rhizobium ruizarguesonis]
MTDRDEPELDTPELGRRAMADFDEMAVEFELDMQHLRRKLHSALDLAQIEAMGMTPRPFHEDTPIKLSDAIYLPVLGGEVLRNGQRTPSPTFTKRSLEGAIDAGLLEGRLHRGKMTVTIKALRMWLDNGAPAGVKVAAAKPARTPAVKSNRERERVVASNALARQMLDGLKTNKK